ncbi:MAG: YqeG family HAD IIIA-type phosphatase [Acetanaerobacterium sp.]
MSKNTIPDLIIDRIWEIDAQVLSALGVRALIVDVDNTLSSHGAPLPEREVAPWLARMDALGVPVVILSNNTKKRVAPFAQGLGLPFVHFAVKPLAHGFQRAARLLRHPAQQIAVVGDQIFTDVVGGNAMGMKTVLVLPIDDDTDRWVRFKRRFEKRYIDQYYRIKGEKNG